jgi:hypothetical protein
MKHSYCILIIFVFSCFSAQSQNSYTWTFKNISFESAENLKENSESNEDNFVMFSENLKVSFSVLGGMDGVDDLSGSLDSYAENFYSNYTKSVDISNQIKGLKGSEIQAQDGPTRILIGMYSDNNRKNYFICYIEYADGNLNAAEKILKSMNIAHGKQNNVVVVPDNNDNHNKKDDNNNNNDNNNSGEPANMKGMVARHNYWRAKVGSPDIQWSQKLADYAQDWANQLKNRDCELEHRPDNDYGENIYAASGMTVTPETVVDCWASELNVFKYEPFTGQRGDGHYTQVVWSKTLYVGCAAAKCPQSEVWVCNYDPAGNYLGEYPYKK